MFIDGKFVYVYCFCEHLKICIISFLNLRKFKISYVHADIYICLCFTLLYMGFIYFFTKKQFLWNNKITF